MSSGGRLPRERERARERERERETERERERKRGGPCGIERRGGAPLPLVKNHRHKIVKMMPKGPNIEPKGPNIRALTF